jgi:hypothetical protein
MSELQSSVAPLAWQRIEGLVASLTGVYGHALARAIEQLERLEPTSGILAMERLCDDPLIESLLLLHGLHPLPLDARVERALARVRHAIGCPPDSIACARLTAATLTVRLSGSFRAHRASADAVQQAIRLALTEAAPEIVEVTIEGLDAADFAKGEGALVQIDLSRSRGSAGAREALDEGAELGGES